MDGDWQDERRGPLECATLHLPGASLFRAVPDPAVLPHALALLGDEEQAQAARFRHAADRLAYVAAHALTRLVLAEALGIAPRELVFARTATGKPVLPNHKLHFNLSHCRDAVAVAISPTAPVGVDMECAGPLDPTTEAVAFAPAECAQLAELAGEARQAAALRLWTLREALAKATGEGLAAPGQTHDFDLTTGRLHGLDPRWGRSAGWRFHSWALRQGLALALAISPADIDAGSRAAR